MEFNKEQLEQAWQERFEREHEYLTLIEGYKAAKQKALDKAEPDSVEYWQLSIEIFDLDTIELEEYIDSKTGKHIKKYSAIYQNNVYFKIDKPYEELKNIILNRSIPILGLAYKSKKYK